MSGIFRSTRCAATLLGVLGCCAAAAAEVAPSLLQNLHWRSIGPYRGGRVLAVEGAPDDRRRFYFGAVNGGVWRTDDAGRTWAPIFDAAPVGSIGALAIAPSAPNILYVGTGEADMRSDIAQGIGMFRSADGGRTWSSIGLDDTQQIGRILVDPRDPNVLLVASLGHPYGPNAMRGVFRSADGGRTWAKTLFRDADTGAIDMAFQPGNPDVVYAALWQTRRPPWNVYPPSSGPGSGLYKSTDGGRTWAQLRGNGLPAQAGRIGLAVTPARPSRVYALIDVKNGGGLYRSEDAGAHWALVSNDKRILERAWYFSGITADPKDPDAVYVCDTVLFRSSDGGTHFVPLKGDPTGDDFHALWIDPIDPARRILGVDQGALVTLNGGQTWSSWYNQPTGQFYHVSTDNRFPYFVYGAQQDTGAAGVPSRTDSPTDGITMEDFHEVAAGGESDNIAPDPDDPETVYGGRVDKLDLRSGQLHSVDPTLAFPDHYRATWTLPLVFGPLDHALYFGNQRIFRTQDGGAHWAPISPDLTRPDPGVPATLDAPTIADTAEPGKRRGVVYAIAPSPLKKTDIWAGTDDGQVWRTRDGGAHWANITPASLQPWSKIGVVEASHFDRETAYLAVDRHRLDDFAPYVLRTNDGGASWAPITAGLADGGTLNSINVVREDPVRRGLLYAGSERSVFVSFDDGTHWQPLKQDLPRTSVRDIDVHGDDLVIATHGRGFYIMDDMVQLRQLAANAAAGPILFAPAPAIRLHPPVFTGTPMPKDEPMAPNPPNGAIIDYALPQDTDGPVQIAILDAKGAAVRRFSSSDPVAKPDLGKIAVAPEWISLPQPPAATPGAHRFVWDLHYTKPAALTGGDPEPQGVWAPPGAYSVVLTVAGHEYRQTLRVLPDPRLKLAPGDLQAQFMLARAIEAARVTCRTALKDAAALRKSLQAEASKADAPRKALLAAKIARLDEAAGQPFDPFGAGGTGASGVGALTSISDRLDALAQAVDGADGAPTPDARAGFATAAADLGRAMKLLAAVAK
jgi:photosystem II stability/assembly factor-like uncharacterized protein